MGICIRHWDWSETSQTVSILTREHGLVRGLAKGARRERAPFSGGIELLTQGEVMAVRKSSSALATVTSWDLVEPYRALRERLGAFYAGMYLADLVNHLVLDSDPHPEVYASLVTGLGGLCGSAGLSAASRERLVLWFQWSILGAVGTRPDVKRDVATGGTLQQADVVCFIPGHGGFAELGEDEHRGWKVRWSTIDALAGLGDAPEKGEAERESVRRAVRLLGAYVHFLIGRELGTLGPVLADRGHD